MRMYERDRRGGGREKERRSALLSGFANYPPKLEVRKQRERKYLFLFFPLNPHLLPARDHSSLLSSLLPAPLNA